MQRPDEPAGKLTEMVAYNWFLKQVCAPAERGVR